MGIRLTIVEGKSAGKEFFFSQARVRIGRAPDSDLVLYDMGVSRLHVELLADAQGCTLRDTGSANGTMLNGVLATEARVQSGDRVQIGPVVFRIELGASPGAARPADTHGEVFRPQDDQQRRALEEGKTTAFRPVLPPPPVKPPPAESALTRGRTMTGSFVAYSRRRWLNFRQLPPSTRIAVVVASLVVLGAIAVSAAMLLRRPVRDRSAEIFSADRTNAALSFGAGKVDITTADRVNFRFDYQGGRATVFYTAGGIDSANELEILLNNKHVGYVEPSPSGWTAGLRLTLPRNLLRPGVNILTFDNTMTPATSERWGIAQVRVQQEPLPAPNQEKAQELFELGKASLEARSVSPPNLYRAAEYFEEAALYLEAMDAPPALLQEIHAQGELARVELQKVFDAYLFASEKALRFGDRAQAIEALRDLLRFFPNADDPRHKKARDRLTDLVGKGAQ